MAGVDLVRGERKSVTGAYLDRPVHAHDEGRGDESAETIERRRIVMEI